MGKGPAGRGAACPMPRGTNDGYISRQLLSPREGLVCRDRGLALILRAVSSLKDKWGVTGPNLCFRNIMPAAPGSRMDDAGEDRKQ